MQTELDRLLVTSALVETLDPSKEIVFLGPWCSHDYQNLKDLAQNSITINYHWDNINKFTEDDLRIHKIYQDSLIKITAILKEGIIVDGFVFCQMDKNTVNTKKINDNFIWSINIIRNERNN